MIMRMLLRMLLGLIGKIVMKPVLRKVMLPLLKQALGRLAALLLRHAGQFAMLLFTRLVKKMRTGRGLEREPGA